MAGLVFVLPVLAQAQQWSGIVDPSRAIDWSNAGVRGGIPRRTTICASLNSGATSSQINSAIASCPSGQVVFLNAGTYGGLSGIMFNGKSGVTLRGAGADKTFLVFTSGVGCHRLAADVCITALDANWRGGPSNSANWTSGYARGTTNIALSSVTNLKVGSPLILDQLDDSSDTGSVFVCQAPSTIPSCSLEGNSTNGQRPNRDQVQIVQVASCGTARTAGQTCNGTNVTIIPGLYMANWNSTKSPGAWWATAPIAGVGIEDLSLDHTASTGSFGIEIQNALDCWVKGVRGIDSGKAHVELQESARITVADNYFYLTQNAVQQSYGVESLNSSDDLIQNNVLQFIAAPLMINGSCSGCVMAYNFVTNDFFTASTGYVQASTNQHTAGIDMLLYEGNVAPQFYADNFHGTHNLVTVFRNQFTGNDGACYNGTQPYGESACNNNQVAMDIRGYSRFYNLIGNVLGQSGTSNGYQSGSAPIFRIGGGNSQNGVTVPSDSLVASTLMRWGNYDVVTAAARWCGNSTNPGWTTTCGGTSEVPTGLSKSANAVPATTSLPASFYLSAKPGWWPSGKAWPPIGPDVRGGNVAGVGGHVYTIPAQDCYLHVMGGVANGTGSVLIFNASRCYASASATSPLPPTGLLAMVSSYPSVSPGRTPRRTSRGGYGVGSYPSHGVDAVRNAVVYWW